MHSRFAFCRAAYPALPLVALLLLSPAVLPAQAGAPAGPQTGVQTGAVVTGTVLDPDSAVIPGATILLTPPKGAAIAATSRGDGSFSVSNVPAGVYTFTVTMQGFGSFVKQNVRVGGQPVKIDVKLSIEEQSTTITVTTNDNQVSVDPDANSSAVVVKGADLDALSDDPDELSNELTALAGPAAGPNGGQIYVDGFTGGQLPPKSAIREIRINQNPYSAQYDQPGFGRIEILTKPGTDKLHGQLSVQGMDKSFNTSSPFLGSSNIQPDYHQLFFIGSVSGAITKGASFNIAGSHRNIQDNNVFSGTVIASTAPGSTALCPPGTVGCASNPYPDAFRATFAPRTRYDFSPRLDYAISDKNTLTARYQFEHNEAQNAGIGGLVLPTAGYNTLNYENNLQISDSQILSPKLINETRFEFRRTNATQTPLSTAPTVTVVGNFTGGGSSAGTQTSTQDHYEVQNYTSYQLQKNFIRAGVRVRIDRTAQFSTQSANGIFSYATVANYLANQPFQYQVANIANPRVSGNLTDVGLYAEDDFKVKPNLTLTYGLRYEAQTDVSSAHDLAPRFSANYGVPRKGGNPLTVLRFGYGIFYNRFAIGDVINTIQQNGINSVVQTYTSPAVGCAPGSTAACGANAAAKPIIYTLASNLRSAYNSQIALGLDQQLPHKTTFSANFISTVGVHQFFSRSLPSTGSNLLYQYQSEGNFRQNQLLLNARSQFSQNFSMFGFYALNLSANSNAFGADTFLTDSLNARTDYGRFVNRSFAVLFASYTAPLHFNLSPFMIARSGSPYNITTGTDVNGDSIINDRAEFASGVNGGNCKVAPNFASPTGTTDVYPRVPQGYCTAPPAFALNLRVTRAFGFGPKLGGGTDQSQGGGPTGPPPGGGGPRGGGGGPRGGGFGGGGLGSGSSGHKYTVSLGAQILNLTNNIPYAAPNGNLTAYNPDPTKNQFGRSQSLINGPFAEGSAVRRVFLQANFSF